MQSMKVASYLIAGTPKQGLTVMLSAPELADVETEEHVIAEGLYARLPAVVVDDDGGDHIVRMVLDMTADGIRPTTVSVVGRDGTPVTGQTLRSVRVAEIFQNAVAYVLHEREPDDDRDGLNPVGHVGVHFADATDPDELATARRAGSANPDFMRRIASMYSAASVAGIPPQKFIMDVTGAPRSTAGYWISQARKRGLIAPAAERRDE